MSRRLTTDDTTIALGDHGDLAGGVACGAGLEGYRAGVSTSQGGVLSVDEFVHVREDDLHARRAIGVVVLHLRIGSD